MIATYQKDYVEISNLTKLNKLLNSLSSTNSIFYSSRDYDLRSLKSLDELRKFPFLCKKDLILDQKKNSPFGAFHCLPLNTYLRSHQTSGTTQKPLKWLDSAADWDWWKKCWSYVYQAAGFEAGDTIFFPFSFNFFIGFWSAYDAAQSLGIRTIAGGGQDSLTRIHTIQEYSPKGLIITPSHCFRLIEKARQVNVDLSSLSVSKIVLAGEAGGSIGGVAEQISTAWNSETFDHYGCTELGAMGYQCTEYRDGFHLNEDEFIFEVIDPHTLEPVGEAETGELVVTNLGRYGSPLIRYRTGDIVRVTHEICSCGRTHKRCIGGILGRVNDTMIVKGVNIYPSAVESVIRNYKDILDFQCLFKQDLVNPEIILKLAVKDEKEKILSAVWREMKNTFHFTFRVEIVPLGSLPKFEGKSKRFLLID